MKRILLLTVIFSLTTIIFAQKEGNYKRCASTEYLEMQKQSDPSLAERMQNIESQIEQMINSGAIQRSSENVFIIPTVVHVVYKTSAQNISDDMIYSQIRVLNEDFRKMLGTPGHNDDPVGADTKIMFRLADIDPNGQPTTGIIRKQTTVSQFGLNDAVKFSSQGGDDAWPSDKYFNIWTANISNGILGYAQFPGGNPLTDGVVILYSAFGYNSPAAPYNKGRTVTHEVGHWVNLYHIWGDGPCGVDDLVADTPESDNSNFGCPTGHISCGSVDMIENYMDYTDDACMNIFTQGQTNRMVATTLGSRASLFTDQPFMTWDNFITISEVSRSRTSDVSRTLVFGFSPNATNGIDERMGEVEMASTIEAGYFDARFLTPDSPSKGTLMDIRGISNTSGAFEIIFQSPNTQSFNFSWNSESLPPNTFFLTDGAGTFNIDMSQTDNYTVTDFTGDRVYINFSIDVIPVELTSFTAKASGSNVLLNWETATETNNQGFEIERLIVSENISGNWTRVGFVEGHGTTSEKSRYSFVDNLSAVSGSVAKYRLKQIDYDGTYTYTETVEVPIVSESFVLEQNYPNPFNPSTTIKFSLPYESNVKITVYNSLGEVVKTLLSGVKPAGNFQVEFNAENISSGIYFYSLNAIPVNGEQSTTKVRRMMLLK